MEEVCGLGVFKHQPVKAKDSLLTINMCLLLFALTIMNYRITTAEMKVAY